MATATGWQGERFRRTKRMDPLHEYLNPPTVEDRREQGARKMRAMLDRLTRNEKDD